MRRTVLVVLALVVVVVMLAGCPTTGKPNMEESLRWYNFVGYIASGQVGSIRKGMTYAEIIQRLGPTRDVGSGLHVAHYIVDETKSLYLSFAHIEDVCSKDGTELLRGLQPVDMSAVDIRGVVKEIVHGKDGITILVEGKQNPYTTLTAANVTVTMHSRVFRGQALVEGSFGFSEIKEGDAVEVTFAGPVSMSYPVQGVAATVRILTVP